MSVHSAGYSLGGPASLLKTCLKLRQISTPFAKRHRRACGASVRTGEQPARLHLDNPMTVQRGYAPGEAPRPRAKGTIRRRQSRGRNGFGENGTPYQGRASACLNPDCDRLADGCLKRVDSITFFVLFPGI